MVVLNREILNKNLLVTSSAMSCPKDISNNTEDVNMGTPKEKSNDSSVNSSRESSIMSKASINVYATCMEIQSKDPNWTNQANTEIFYIPVSSQVGRESNNQVLVNLDSNGLTTYVDLAAISFLSGVVYTGVEVHKMDLEMCGLVEQPWL